MKRLVPFCAGAILLVLTMPSSAFGQAPADDSVTGEAGVCAQVLPNGFCESHSIRVDARSGPDGENPTGTLHYEFSFGTPSSTGFIESQVTCLSVAGNLATIGFTGREFDTFLEFFVAGLVTVEDGGGPGPGLDRFHVRFLARDFDPVPPATDCAGPPDDLPWVNDEGDLSVVDAPSLPSSKEQCRHGGWRNFGVFKNQGDCVSFVATGGKNPPGKTG
jgi:hypothetical protein